MTDNDLGEQSRKWVLCNDCERKTPKYVISQMAETNPAIPWNKWQIFVFGLNVETALQRTNGLALLRQKIFSMSQSEHL